MVADPQILKDIVLTIDTEDFSGDVTAARMAHVPGAIQTVKTLDGTKHQDAEGGTWQLELTCVIDWDSTRPGLARFLFDHDGETLAFTFKDDESANSTAKPLMTGNLVCVPIAYGGEGNVFATAEVVLPIDGTPVPDTTP
jgi:hypothetical protein